jgi:2-hydroxychromene-2-carboxylate isomerase
MAPQIDYYFITPSPWAYLGHAAFHEIAARHGATIRYRPVRIADVWANSGSVPLGQRPPLRQRYRLIELQRYSALRGLPVNLSPKFFPVDSTLADSCVIAIQEQGDNPAAYCLAVHSAIWAQDRNVADEAVVVDLLASTGHDPQAVLDAARSERVAAIRDENTKAAIAADAVGAPAYVLNGEPFWGQDHLDVLEQALASGREPFRAA